MFAYQHFGVKPDIIGLAKGRGPGVPIGAVLAKEHFAAAFSHGSHGPTYRGKPLSFAAALATLKEVEKLDFCDKARVRRNYLKTRLNEVSTTKDEIRRVRV